MGKNDMEKVVLIATKSMTMERKYKAWVLDEFDRIYIFTFKSRYKNGSRFNREDCLTEYWNLYSDLRYGINKRGTIYKIRLI